MCFLEEEKKKKNSFFHFRASHLSRNKIYLMSSRRVDLPFSVLDGHRKERKEVFIAFDDFTTVPHFTLTRESAKRA